MSKFEKVESKREIRRDVHDNEAFLVFHSDAGAITFHEWWDMEGAEIFNKYYEENKHFYS